MKAIKIISLILIILFASGCKPPKSAFIEVPLKHQITEELHEVSLPVDSSEIRLKLEYLPSGNMSITQIESRQGKTASAPIISWERQGDDLNIKAAQPQKVVQIPSFSEVKEIPIRVEVPVEVNKLKWWQKGLMWIGGIAMIYLLSRSYKGLSK